MKITKDQKPKIMMKPRRRSRERDEKTSKRKGTGWRRDSCRDLEKCKNSFKHHLPNSSQSGLKHKKKEFRENIRMDLDQADRQSTLFILLSRYSR